MPVISHKNPLVLLKNFRDNTTSRTGLNLFTADSKIAAISNTLSAEAITLREEQIAASYADKISSANGVALDAIGERLGIFRIRASHAGASASERVFGFYVDSGTFGDINGAAAISITAGTRLYSDANENELNTTVDYTVVTTTVLPAAGTIGYVAARAVNIGTKSNVGKAVIRHHNFTGYTDSLNNTLKVVNFYPILNGRDDEPDELYRFRLANHYNRLLQNNEIKLTLTALDMPGVINTLVEPGYFGIGTAAVFALGPENQSNSSLITGLQQRLDSWRTPGGEYLATPATEVSFDFELEITPSKTLTATQISRLKSEINKGFLTYFRELTLGHVVDLDILASAVQKRISLGAAAFLAKGTNQVFKRVYVRRGYAGGVSDERSRMIGKTYALERDEFASLGLLTVEVV